jgi:UDP:flavonoid glycosyltransferase YjiC (YdhE family)
LVTDLRNAGEVEPHLALGQELSRHGHHVRIATHGAFQEIVSHAGLEFFDIGGDPNELIGGMTRSKWSIQIEPRWLKSRPFCRS